MNNWKLRSTITGQDGMDFVEVNGHLASFDNTGDTLVEIVPFGDKLAAPLRNSATDDFGPVSNQVPGICNGTFTHTGAASGNVASTTLTGEGSGAFFNYTFLADGTLSTITANTTGSNYKVGDKLRITTSVAHGSQVIEFRLVDGSNARSYAIRLVHDQGVLPYAVHKVRITETSDHTIQVLDYRNQQVFPRPQDKLLDKYPDAAAAYGLRKLRSAYQGPCIRARRESPGTPEIDVFFDAQGNLDTKTLLDFAGTANVRCKIWYDQSGNGNDAMQTGNSLQPRIVTGGVLETVNDKPALDFDGSNDKFSIDSSDLYGQDRLDAYTHYQTTDTAHILFSDPDSDARCSFVMHDGSTSTALELNYDIDGTEPEMYINGVKAAITDGSTTRGDLHEMVVDNGAAHSNGAVVVHEAAGTQGWTDFGISTYGSVFPFNGKLTEVVLYNTDQSANRENIEKDMALYSGAYQVEDAPLLDAYGGAHAAYSLRKLNSDYTGAAIRVRAARAGNPEQDIGFDADGNLDTAALLTFAASNFCHLKTWYDQSGNGNDVTQTATGEQPIIAFSEAVQTVDGRPAVRFEASTFDALPFDSTGLDIGNLSSFAVGKFSNTTGTQYLLAASGNAGGNVRWQMPVLFNGNFNYAYGGAVSGVATLANTANNLHSMIAGATQTDMEAFLNGTSIGTLSLTTGIDSTTTGIGALGTGGFMNGFIQEVVVYSSDQSERRLGIERNIKNHYEL